MDGLIATEAAQWLDEAAETAPTIHGVGRPVAWIVAPGLSAYAPTVDWMERRAAGVAAGAVGECILLVEHPPVVTAGTSTDRFELQRVLGLPVVPSGRGGRITYHGPGQRVVYPILDLGQRRRDVRAYVHELEQWLIDALFALGVAAQRSGSGTGVWLGDGADEAKLAAIGVRLRRWVTLHGASVNVDTDLAAYAGFVPCGIADRGVTRLADVDPGLRMADLDRALWRTAADFLQRIGVPGNRPPEVA